MSTRTLNLDDALYSYLLEVSVRETPLLARLRRETARHPRGRMQISPEQGQLLRFLLRLMGARRALEIGVFTGYSTLCLALALPEDGCITACDVSAEWTAVGQRYWAEAGVAASPDISPGFRSQVRLQWFWVRAWTDRDSRSYLWREGACPGPLQACMIRNNTLLHLENRQCLSFATSWIPFLVSW